MSYQFKKDLWHKLTNDETVSGLISTRLYPGIAPQKATYPFVTFNTVSNMDENCHDGPVGIFRERVQFDILADTPDVAEQIKDAIYSALHGLSGMIGATDATIIGSSRFDSEIDLSEWEEDKARKTVDFLISYK